ncbi:glycosyltransferase family 4 protein [Methylobacterium sp. CM6257]
MLTGDSRTSGGAEAQIAYLAAALAACGHAVSIIYGDGRGSNPPETVSGVLCIDAAPDWRRPKSFLAFWRALRRFAPDILYARLPSDFLVFMGLAARVRPRACFVYALAHDLHTRAWSAFDHRRWFHAPLFTLGLYSANLIAVQHERQRAALAPTLRAKTTLLPNIVRDIRSRPRNYDSAHYDVIWIAKIRLEKRLDRLLDLAQACPTLTFAVVGGYDPVLPSDVRLHLAHRAASLKNVSMLGELRADDVQHALAHSKVLVNTSDAEGFPNTMLEAWSLGVPVVSLSVDPGGVIVEEALGLVSSDVHVLISNVMTLVHDADLNQVLGANGLDYVGRRHAPDVVVSELKRIYCQR